MRSAQAVSGAAVDDGGPEFRDQVELLINANDYTSGVAQVELVDGVPDAYVAAARKLTPAEHMADWEKGVRAPYDQMVRITVEPKWAKLLDFESTLPKAVEDLVLGRV